MATESGSGKVVVSLDALIAQLNDLKGYIGALQAQIDQLTLELTEIRSSEELISELKTKDPDEILAPTDRRGHVLIRAAPKVKGAVVTHIGQNFYAEVPLEKAISILLEKEKDVRNLLSSLQKELAKATQYYQQLEAVVNTVLSQARKQGSPQELQKA
jgi:prefoldin alpha subunit